MSKIKGTLGFKRRELRVALCVLASNMFLELSRLNHKVTCFFTDVAKHYNRKAVATLQEMENMLKEFGEW